MAKQKTLLEFIKKSRSLDQNIETNKLSEIPKENTAVLTESINVDQHQQQDKPMLVSETKPKLIVDRKANLREQLVEEKDYSQHKRFDYLDFRVYIPEGLDLNNEKIYKFYREPHYIDSADYVYLLDVKYDGDLGKAVLILYDVNNKDLIYYYDKTGHKPYFLTDIPPEKVNKILDIVRHKSFDSIETVDKFDPLRNTNKRFTKIVVKDPLAVRTLRNKVPIA
ncbi:MAG: type B DNA-directed DNA polymerase, partial [Ignisphaera sp.]